MAVRPDQPVTNPVLVLGEFDGFHLGHRQLVHQAALVAARMRRPLVAAVLVSEPAESLLTTVDERCWALLASGVSGVHVVSIGSAGDPVDDGRLVVDEIVARLAPAAVVMACLPTDATSARHPSIRAEFARRSPEPELVEVRRWEDPDGRRVTSSRVREALRRGDIVAANDWLGRTFVLTGTVVRGSGLGRTIGFPTANLELDPHRLVPMNGVYAGVADLPDGEQRRAAINIGVRPTIDDHGPVVVEAHLLDFDGDLYGATIDLGFRRWLRHEHRFDSVDALVAQLAVDVEQTGLLIRGADGTS